MGFKNIRESLDNAKKDNAATRENVCELLDRFIEKEIQRIDEKVREDSRSKDMHPDENAGIEAVALTNIDEKSHTLYNPEELEKLFAEAKHQPEDVRDKLKYHLNRIAEVGPTRQLAPAPDISKISELRNNFPHFESAIEIIESHLALSHLQTNPIAEFPVLLLTGPAGVGKTMFSKAMAKMSNAPFLEISMASATAGFILSGLDLSWSSGRPGKIFSSLAVEKICNPVFLLDEIEKTQTGGKYDVTGSLFSLLEKHSAQCWRDEAVPLGLDCSKIQWIATANNPDWLDPALHSRFEVVEIPLPSESHTRKIGATIYAALLRENNLQQHFAQELPDDVAEYLSNQAPRSMKHMLKGALGKAALARREKLLVSDFPKKASEKCAMGFLN